MSAHLPKRFLFTVGGGSGHFHPLVPLAQALEHTGHAVAFVSGPIMQQLVESSGFHCFVLTAKPADDPEYQQFKAQLRTMPMNLATELFSYPRIFAGMACRLRTPQMIEIARQWQPDMFIREGAEYSALVAAEYLGLPHATVAFTSALRGMSIFEREVPEQLNPVRQSVGLAADLHHDSLYRYLYLAYTPPGFALQDAGYAGEPHANRNVPLTTHFVRPDLFDQSGSESLPTWVDQMPARPTVYATMGTEVNRDPQFYPSVLQTIIEGLRDLPINLIVTLGRGNDPAHFGPQPSNVHIEPYIPQSLLLPRCDLMLMHGGSNSVLAALDLGLPLVIVPLIADQFFNANITEKIGLGKVVSREQLTPEAVRNAVVEVLHNPVYRSEAGKLRAELHALPGIERAVELVEKVAIEGMPQVNPDLPGA